MVNNVNWLVDIATLLLIDNEPFKLAPHDVPRLREIANALESIPALEHQRDQLRQQVADLQFEVLELKTINHTLMMNNPLRQQALKDHGTR